jgi:hypothetical protein
MGELLKIIQVKPNARPGDLLPGWRDFVVGHSNVRQESVVKHFLTTGSRVFWIASSSSGTDRDTV